MATPDYQAISETLHTMLQGEHSLIQTKGVKTHVQEAAAIIDALAAIDQLPMPKGSGNFIPLADAKAKRAVFLDKFGKHSQKLPKLLQFNALLITADLLSQLSKFRKKHVKTELILVYPACNFTEKDGKRTPTDYTQIYVAVDADGKPIVASDMDKTDLAVINEGIANTRFQVASDRDVVDEIRHCPPEKCDDIA